MTDLDGTAVHEFRGRVVIPDPVSHGLTQLRDQGRPVVLNTLRFPLNVIRTFGREWYEISNAPLPLVSLNGSTIGYLTQAKGNGAIAYEEIEAYPLTAGEIDEVIVGVRGLLDGGITDLLVFFYRRDWLCGETIWTPSAERTPHLRAKYPSATRVVAGDDRALRDELMAEDVCMIFLLIDVPDDQLMAYQHSKRTNFVTRSGVDKLSGAEALARHLQVDLAQTIGAGDTPMDTFLQGVGLAVIVGSMDLEFKGLSKTLRVKDALEFGSLLFRLAALQRELAA